MAVATYITNRKACTEQGKDEIALISRTERPRPALVRVALWVKGALVSNATGGRRIREAFGKGKPAQHRAS